MGWPSLTKEERDKRNAAEEDARQVNLRQRRNAVSERRKQLAKKIVESVSAEIVGVIIRPGPKQEERECTTVAKELYDLTPSLESLVLKALDTE
jgi:hypothetical protein